MIDELIDAKRRLARIRLWHVWLSGLALANVIVFAWLRMTLLLGIAFGGAMIPPVYLWWSGREARAYAERVEAAWAGPRQPGLWDAA